MVVLVVFLAFAVALLTLLVAGLLRSHAEIIRVLHGIGVDLDPTRPESDVPRPAMRSAGLGRTDAVEIVGVSPRLDPSVVSLRGDHETLLVFLTTGCLTCRTFWDELREPLLRRSAICES